MIKESVSPHFIGMSEEMSMHGLRAAPRSTKPPRTVLAEADVLAMTGRGDSLASSPIANKYTLSNLVLDTVSNGGSEAPASTSLWRMMDYGVSAEQGTRRTMEDQHIMLAEGIPFFGVYDGHGGTACAEYLRDNLHTWILSHPEVKTNPEKAVKEGILEADKRFLNKCTTEHIDAGCVCAVVMFVGDKLVVGNVGDTEVVLCRDGVATVLTTKHSPRCNPSEADRVKSCGGKVVGHRVAHPQRRGGTLAVSRAIGDVTFKLDSYTAGKPSGLIADPHVVTQKILPQDEFIVIGCDGLWDVLTHQEVVDICRKQREEGEGPNSITEALVDEAIHRGSTDNVTVAFISVRTKSNADLTRHRSSAKSFTMSRKDSEFMNISR